MKLKMYFLLLALGALGLQSCNDDDDHLSSCLLYTSPSPRD